MATLLITTAILCSGAFFLGFLTASLFAQRRIEDAESRCLESWRLGYTAAKRLPGPVMVEEFNA